MIRDLLLWVGHTYYTQETFLEEANRIGICRRVQNEKEITQVVSKAYLVSEMNNIENQLYQYSIALQKKQAQIRQHTTNDIKTESRIIGKPVLFCVFTINRVVYVTNDPSSDESTKHRILGHEIYDQKLFGFGFNHERHCGSLRTGTYLISEHTMEDLQHPNPKNIQEITPRIPYKGKRFIGKKYITEENKHEVLQLQ